MRQSDPTKESGTKLDACIEWVESEIAKTLEEDPSGFLLGIQSVAVVEALRDVAAERDALREVLEQIVKLTVIQPVNKPGTQAAREIAAAALERPE